MDTDRLFCHTLTDLDRRVQATDEYEVLLAAALLRKLLVDGNALVHQVNRRHRLKLCFRISGVSPFEQLILDSNPVFWALEDALDPDKGPPAPVLEASLDQFLARQLIRFNGESITIRDVIDQLANVEGAVHKGEPKTDRDKTLAAAQRFYSRDGLPGIVSQVRLIGRIARSGLTPLQDAVVASTQ